MRTIRIAYVDFWKTLDIENFIFTRILKKHYEVVFDQENPEFVFCSNFGTDYLNYHCPRILFLGEAKAPDFNVYDYAIAFDSIQFGDRYLQYPLFLTYEKNFELALKKHQLSDEEYLAKDKFCNTVVSNNLGGNVRDAYFEALCAYKKVDSGGRHKNNLPGGKPVEDKLEFQKKYRYSFAFENSQFPGYVTEKIVDAWAAGTVPLYWGAPDVAEYFNPEAFIDCSRMQSPKELVKKIEELEENPELYLKMMKAPAVLPDSRLNSMMQEAYLEEFLLAIFQQEPEKALRRNSAHTMWGYNYEHHMMQWKKLESKKLFQMARDFMRKHRK